MSSLSRHTRPARSIYRLPQVMAATGFGRAWIYELMKRGDFPHSCKIGSRAIGWSAASVDAWIADKLGERA